MDKPLNRLISIDPEPARLASKSADTLHPGSSCPNCGTGRLDYNGLLELECDRCGTVFGSSTTCT